jgi:hypothetical protein
MAKPQPAKKGHPPKKLSKQWLPEGVEVRTIGISIEGYDPEAITRAQELQRLERRKRLQKRDARRREEEQRASEASAAEVEAFAASMGKLDSAEQYMQFEQARSAEREAPPSGDRELMRAFGLEPNRKRGSRVDA